MRITMFGPRIWPCKGRYLHPGESFKKNSISSWLLLSYSSYSDTPGKKTKATPLQERRMMDRFRLHVKGGHGGNGNFSMRRTRTDRHGKPDGGNGGRGGDVILQCTSAPWDFRGLQHHINGRKGGHGSSKNMIGSRGEDKVVQVPVGTVIHLLEGEIPSKVENSSSGVTYPWDIPGEVTSDFPSPEQRSTSVLHEPEIAQEKDVALYSCSSTDHTTLSSPHIKSPTHSSSIQARSLPNLSRRKSTYCEEDFCEEDFDDCDLKSDSGFSEEEWEENVEEIQYNVAELTEEGQQILVACGGEGGLGSVSCGKHSKMNLKDDEFEEPSIRIGLPGSQAVLILELKSIADVGLVGMPNAGKSTLLGAITRAKPNVGDYAFTTIRPNLGRLNYDEFSVLVADVPGLLKGAHENRGLGHAFLRHIERTKILVYVVDLVAALDDRKGIPPWEQLEVLVSELEHYREGLSDRPSLVVANKTDELGAEGVFEELKRRVQGIPIYPVCAVLEEGITELKDGLRSLVNGGKPSRLRLDNILVD